MVPYLLYMKASGEELAQTHRREIKMNKLYLKLQKLVKEEGQDLIEYALVVALIAFAATAGMNALAGKINTAFTNIGTTLSTYTS
jgi:pilus assembly protein Flp/PilA